MTIQPPNITCKIEAYCPLFPSENNEKIRRSLENIIEDAEIKETPNSVKAFSKSINSISKIYESIQSKKTQRVYRRQLMKNLRDDNTWFYLNKQAAFMNTIALCENEEESPLGPIKIILTSQNIETMIDWLSDSDL